MRVPSSSRYPPVACAKRALGLLVASETHAFQVPPRAADVARVWQGVSAPAAPPSLPSNSSCDTNTRRATVQTFATQTERAPHEHAASAVASTPTSLGAPPPLVSAAAS